MKRILPLLALIPALLIGLLLPQLAAAVQDAQEERDEAAGIEQVNLTVESGLSILEKLALFNSPEASFLGVSNGVHQTSETLSKASWQVISSLLVMDNQLLKPETAVQEQQTAVLLSREAQAYLYWEVVFRDGGNNVLRLYLDDETALPLAISYMAGDGVGHGPGVAEYGLVVICSLANLNMDQGVENSLAEAEGVEGYGGGFYGYDGMGNYEFGWLVSDGTGASLELWASGGADWFHVNRGYRLGD